MAQANNTYRETSSTSWFGRLKQALTGILVGLILVALSLVLLFWNEGRAIKTYRALTEGAGSIISVDAAKVDPTHEGKLIHIAGAFTPKGTPADADLGVAAEGAVRLIRKVEMYQWKETQHSETKTKLGGGEETVTTYEYSKDWSSEAIDSARFKVPDGHANPSMPIKSNDFAVSSGDLGAFSLTGEQIGGLGEKKPVTLVDADAARIKDRVAPTRSARIDQGRVFIGYNLDQPWIGDLRISFEAASLPQVSAAGAQKGNGLVDYVTSNGQTIFLTQAGIVSAAQMFADAQAGNTVVTWVLRAVGLMLLLIGFTLILRIFGVAGDVIPVFGDVVRFGTGLIAFLLTALLGSLAIALGWFYYRPLWGLAILAVGFLIAGFLWYRGSARAKTAPAAS